MRVLTYRTVENVIAGVVMTFADITAIKQLEESLRQQQESLRQQQVELQAARDYAQNIIATIREPLVVLDGELRVVSASAAFYETFQVTPAVTEGQLLYEVGQRQWDIPSLRQLLEEMLPKSTRFEDFRVEHDFPTIGHKVLMLNARQIELGAEPARLILLAMEDITAASAAPKQTGP
jgi:PAS domain-containing protein